VENKVLRICVCAETQRFVFDVIKQGLGCGLGFRVWVITIYTTSYFLFIFTLHD
jgi:hypothetical protein